nr:hypothetical protein [Tanacetum cinerariifolium]
MSTTVPILKDIMDELEDNLRHTLQLAADLPARKRKKKPRPAVTEDSQAEGHRRKKTKRTTAEEEVVDMVQQYIVELREKLQD